MSVLMRIAGLVRCPRTSKKRSMSTFNTANLLVKNHQALVNPHLRGRQTDAIGSVHESQHLLGGVAKIC